MKIVFSIDPEKLSKKGKELSEKDGGGNIEIIIDWDLPVTPSKEDLFELEHFLTDEQQELIGGFAWVVWCVVWQKNKKLGSHILIHLEGE